jgi:two-component system cell cycle response regulator
MGAPRVLIADDSPLVLRMIEKIVTEAGFLALTARDGLEAVETALTEPVDLVILDVTMPRMNGYQACRLLKNDPSTRDLPVVILTSKDQAGDRYWGLETGADYYVTKDTDPLKIRDLIRNILANPPRERKPVQHLPGRSADVLSHVNDLLDRRLFQATILSEIGWVARKVAALDETFTSVMSLVARVVDFTVGAVALVEGEDLDVLIALHRATAPEVVEEAKARLRRGLVEARGGTPLGQVRARVFTPRDGPVGPVETTLDGYAAFPILTGTRLKGLLALGGRAAASLAPETEAFLRQVAGQAHIVIENSLLVERLRDLAVRDGLTGLFNHRHSLELLVHECDRASRYPGHVSLLMIDIDHFKEVNDRHGHQAGDHVLREVAALLREGVRNVDVLGRYGGEEFIAILPHTEREDAQLLAERLRQSIAEHAFRVGDAEVRATVSIGVATWPSDQIAASAELVREADRALYRAKAEGRNRVV